MTTSNGYIDMGEPNRTDQLFESALAYGSAREAEAQVFADFIEDLRVERDLFGAPSDAAAHITAAAAAVPEMGASAPRSSRRASDSKGLRRRVLVLSAAFAMLLATAGIGLADDAVPGDPLYGLDLALENLGIGDGGASERAQEVLQLLAEGERGRALGHAAETVATLPEGASAAAAQEALQAVADKFSEDDSKVPDGVAELLAALAESVGSGDGESIAEIAKAIRASVGNGPPIAPPGLSGETPGPPATIPGPPANAGG